MAYLKVLAGIRTECKSVALPLHQTALYVPLFKARLSCEMTDLSLRSLSRIELAENYENSLLQLYTDLNYI